MKLRAGECLHIYPLVQLRSFYGTHIITPPNRLIVCVTIQGAANLFTVRALHTWSGSVIKNEGLVRRVAKPHNPEHVIDRAVQFEHVVVRIVVDQ